MEIDLEQNIINDMSKQLADDIDWEIITGFLIESGWNKVVLEPMTKEHSDNIDQWVLEHIKGKHTTRGLVWVFEEDKDAMWFKLKWMSA